MKNPKKGIFLVKGFTKKLANQYDCAKCKKSDIKHQVRKSYKPLIINDARLSIMTLCCSKCGSKKSLIVA